MKKRYAYPLSGAARLEIVPAPELGLVDCNGEAHTNAYIDHCGQCLEHTWGKMMQYGKLDIDACTAGKAVRVVDSEYDVFTKAKEQGLVRMISVEERKKNCTVSYMVWVRT